MTDEKILLLNGIEFADLDRDYFIIDSAQNQAIRKVSLRSVLTSAHVLAELQANEDALVSQIVDANE